MFEEMRFRIGKVLTDQFEFVVVSGIPYPYMQDYQSTYEENEYNYYFFLTWKDDVFIVEFGAYNANIGIELELKNDDDIENKVIDFLFDCKYPPAVQFRRHEIIDNFFKNIKS